ncbi:MAG: DMSO/TMAO reductase YedYZ molybdopterin-dependent catalytic subunit [Pseudohongiellaceae bacterium]|jgi:DMSO/TMAO reductase YedYZ molybdopterin-dependent catalytic subunit
MPFRKAPANTHGILTIEGECARPTAFSYHDMANLHIDYQVPDVSKIDARMKGTAVRLRGLIDIAGPVMAAKWLTVESEDGKFSASLPLREASETALIIYGQGKKPLERDGGGPVRFIIPFHPDNCTKVKGASKISLTAEKGKDTRPSTAAEHKAIHAKD